MKEIFTAPTLLIVLSYIGYQLKTLPKTIWEQVKKKIVFTANIEETTELFTYLSLWLADNHEKHFKNVRAHLTSEGRFGLPNSMDDEKKQLQLQHFSDIFILKYNGKRLLINKGREKFENASDFRSAYYNHYKIEGWFAKETITQLLKEVVVYNDAIKKTVQNIYVNGGYSYAEWSNFGAVQGKGLESIFIDKKQFIVDDITDFLAKESWYLKRGLAYRRGYLFHGLPGNGKTSLCLALAKHFNRDIYFLNLNDIEKDCNLFNTFRNIKNNSILVIEDVDSVFGSREQKSKVSFSAILNCIDGALSKHGIITIMTTNHIEKLDPALIREGRIDMKVEVSNPSKAMVEEYLFCFYGKPSKLEDYNQNISMSKVQELCLENKTDVNAMVGKLQSTFKNLTSDQIRKQPII